MSSLRIKESYQLYSRKIKVKPSFKYDISVMNYAYYKYDILQTERPKTSPNTLSCPLAYKSSTSGAKDENRKCSPLQ